jgi:predicted nucleic acid-binding protein
VILVDASVLIHYLRTPSTTIRDVLSSNDCAVCGVTRAEILHGAKSEADSKALINALHQFMHAPIHDDVWDRLGELLATLRSRGLPMPFQDVLLAVIAMEYDAELWTYDAHFKIIQTVAPNLKLFQGPSS